MINVVISSQIYHNTKWNIYFPPVRTKNHSLSAPTELLAQFDFDRMFAAFSVLLERTWNIFKILNLESQYSLS